MSSFQDDLDAVRIAWRQLINALDDHLHVRALLLRISRWLP